MKAVLFLIVVVCAVTENNAWPANPDDMQNLFINNVNKVVSDAKTAAATAMYQAEQLKKQLQIFVESSTKDLQKQAETSLSVLQASVSDAVSRVATSAMSCALEQSEAFKALARQTVLNVTGCVTERVASAFEALADIITSSLSMIIMAVTIVPDVHSTCAKISPVLNNLFCSVDKVNVYAGNLVTNITKLASSVNRATNLVTSLATLQVDLTTCAASRSAIAAFNTIPIVGNIGRCTILNATQDT